MSDRARLAVLEVGLVLAICFFLFFFGLGSFGLVGADEPRYAQISREMLARHDWIVPTLNGAPWLEKPVLLYWKVMGSYRIFGVQDWAARLPAAFHAAAMVLVIFFFMRRFRPGSELDAALMSASSAGVIGLARAASTDMPLSAAFSVALLAWWAWHETQRKLWLAVFYALLAAGALAKGPVAPALAVLIVGAYALGRRDAKIFLRSLWLPGFGLFFLIALPWYVALQIKVPQFFRVFFLEHNLARFSTNLYQHAQPFWYYIPVFLLATLPWTLFTLPALADSARTFWKELRRGAEQGALASASQPRVPETGAVGDHLPLFLLLWTIVPIVFFSISRSKLPAYILPAIPPAAVLTADYVHRRRSIPHLQLALHSLLCGGIVAGALLVPWIALLPPQSHCGFWCKLATLNRAMPDQTKVWVALIAAIIVVLALVMVRRGGLRFLRFATLLPVVVALAFLLRPAAAVIDATLSARAVNLRLKELGLGNAPVAVFNVRRDVAYGLNFYRNQPITYYEREGPRDLPSGIPSQEHVVVAQAGSEGAVQAAVGARQVTRLGDFPPQHLEFFLVSNLK